MSHVRGDSSPKESGDARCAAIASRQFGLISLAQTREVGLDRAFVHRRATAGRWERIVPEVYRLAGVPSSWQQLLMAAVLWVPRSAVSHRAAAALWELDGFPRGAIELSTASNRKSTVSWITLHRTSRLDRSDVTSLGSLSVTTPTRTIVDLCGVASWEEVEPALDDALRRGLTSLPRLRWAAGRLGGKGRSGARLLAALLAERGPGSTQAASFLESRLRRLLHRSALPKPAEQHEIRDRGRLLARVDFAYPEARLGIEADGYRYHSGRAAWQRDRARRNALTSLEWRILNVTWDDLECRPSGIVSEIRAALLGDPAATASHRSRP